MNTNRTALHINSEGPKPEAIEQGIRWLAGLVTKNPKKNKALIVVNAKSVMDGVISDVLGENAVKALNSGKKVKLGSVGEISMATDRTLPSSWDGPILAVYPSKKVLNKIDSLSGVTDVLLIPWTLSEIQFWIDTWSSSDLNTSKPSAKKTRLDPILETALISLSERVNLSTGLAHPSDRAATIQMFEVLVKNRIPYNNADVRAWLVSEGGWAPSDADDVVEIAQGVLAGKRFRAERKMWREDIFDIWKQDAAKKGGGV